MSEWVSGLSEAAYILLGYGIFFLGFCMPLLFRVERPPMTRLPYFLLAIVGFTAIQFVGEIFLTWLAFSLVERGFGGGAFLAGNLIFFVALGAVYGEVAIRRSLDAFGTRRRCFLAMVPLLNFWLVFAPSREAATRSRRPLADQLSFVATSILFLGLATIATFGAWQILRNMEGTAVASSSPPLGDLEAQLKSDTEALNARLPLELHENLILTSARAKRLVVRYDFVIDLPEVTEDYIAAYRSQLESSNAEVYCAGSQRSLLDQGGMIIEAFSDRSGAERILLRITEESCR